MDEEKAPTHDDDGFPIGKRAEFQDMSIAHRKADVTWTHIFEMAKGQGYIGTLAALKEACKNANGGKLPEPEKLAPIDAAVQAEQDKADGVVSKKPTPKTKKPKKTAPKSSGKPKKPVSKGKVKPKAKKPSKGKGKAKKTPTTRKKREGLSGLDAAAQVVKASKRPLTVQEITDGALKLGWKTKGKTPDRTLNSAIIREMRDKETRFKRVGRGEFVAA